MDFWLILYIIDWFLFILTAGTVLYLSIFSVASHFGKRSDIPKSKKQNRIVVLIPSYKQDNAIEQTVISIRTR